MKRFKLDLIYNDDYHKVIDTWYENILTNMKTNIELIKTILCSYLPLIDYIHQTVKNIYYFVVFIILNKIYFEPSHETHFLCRHGVKLEKFTQFDTEKLP